MRVSRSVFAGGLLVAAAGLLVFGLLCRNGGPVLAEPGAEPVPAEAAELQPAGGAPAQPATYAVTLPAEDEARKARPAPPSPGAIGLPPPPGPPPGLQRRPPGERPSGPPPPLPEELRKGPPTDVPTHLPNPEELREHFALLQRFLELPPERLARIRESIERIERLPEERKQMMLEHIRRAQPVAPRKVLVSPLTEVPAEMRPRLESVWNTLQPDARDTILERLQPMSAEERRALLEGLVLHAELLRTQIPWAAPEAAPALP